MVTTTHAPSTAGNAERVERLENQYYGKYRGVVIANDDPEHLGRLRLWVPSLFPTEKNATPKADSLSVSDWAWPCLPFGGSKDQGMFFIPEVGAKLWVEYEEGNLDSPIWVGVFWSRPNGESEIPKEAQDMTKDSPQRRVLKTPSGHVLEFCDEKGKESITLRHADGANVNLDENGSVTIGNKLGTFVYLNAKEKELSFATKDGNIARFAGSNVTLMNSEGTTIDMVGASVQIVATNIMLRSDTVSLGEGAMEPAILGRSFAAIFDAHTHPTALGPSGPPIPVPMPLSAPMNPAISKSVMVK